MRSDGRQPQEMRPVRVMPDYIGSSEGSVLIEVGNTRVICTASLEPGVPQFLRGSGKGWVTAEYGMLPGSTHTRTPREAARGRVSGRTHEIQRLIGRALRSVTDLSAIGENTVWLDCDVIQADGGTRTAAITGACIALSLAFGTLVKAGSMAKNPVRDHVAAVSVGIVDGTVLLDLAYQEDSRAEVDMNLVLTGAGRFVEVQATAEQQAFGDEALQQMLAYGRAGVESLVRIQREVAPLLAAKK